jgi:hypothetical protein
VFFTSISSTLVPLQAESWLLGEGRFAGHKADRNLAASDVDCRFELAVDSQRRYCRVFRQVAGKRLGKFSDLVEVVVRGEERAAAEPIGAVPERVAIPVNSRLDLDVGMYLFGGVKRVLDCGFSATIPP